MAISKGDRLPDGKLLKLGANGPEEVQAADLAKGRVAIFAVPGAYTPTCTNQHMPSFVKNAANFRDKGIDRIVCVTVNDPFVAAAWGKDTGASDAGIEVLADADGSFTKVLGLSFDAAAAGLLGRSKRYAMLLSDGTVERIEVEEAPGTCSVTSGESLLEQV